MLYNHVTNPFHTFQHPKVEYTLELREEIWLVKIMDARDMQLRDKMVGMDYQGGNVETRRMKSKPSTHIFLK